MIRNKIKFKIKNFKNLVMGFLLVALLILSYFFYQHKYDSFLDEQITEIESITEFNSKTVNLWLQERQKDAQLIFSSKLLQNSVWEIVEQKNIDTQNDKFLSYFSLFSKICNYENVCLFDTNCNELASVKSSHQISSEVINKIKTKGVPNKVNFSCIYIVNHTNYYIDIYFPVMDKSNSFIMAYFVITINPSMHLLANMHEGISKNEFEEKKELIFYQICNNKVFSINSRNEIFDLIYDPSLNFNFTNIENIYNFDNKDKVFIGTKSGTQYLVSVQKLNNNEFYVSTEINFSDLLSNFRYQMFEFFLFVIGFFILLVFLNYQYNLNKKNNAFKELYNKELELRKYLELFKTVLYNIGDSIVILDIEGKISHLNKSAEYLINLDEETVRGKHYSQILIIHDDIYGLNDKNPIDDVIESGKNRDFNRISYLLNLAGKNIPISLNCYFIYNESKEAIGYVIVIKNQTNELEALSLIKRNEEKSRFLLQKLNDSQEIARVGAIEIDLMNNKVWWSDVMYNLLELDKYRINLTSDTHYDYIISENQISLNKLVMDSVNKGERFQHDIILRGNLGTFTHCKMICKGKFEDGKLSNIMISIIDTTEIENAHKEILDNKNKYKTLIETMTDGFIIHRNKIIEYINCEGLKIFGVEDKNQIIGKSILDLTPEENWEIVDNRLGLLENLNILPVHSIKCKKMNGDEIYIESATSKLIDRQGNYYQIVFRDITERKIAVEKLILSEKNLELYLSNSPISIISFDNNLKILDVNQACIELFGYSFDEFLNLEFNQLCKRTSSEMNSFCLNKISNFNDFNLDILLNKKKEQSFWASIHGAKISDLRYALFIINIDSLKKVESELIFERDKAEELNRLKTYFLSNMSHELRTPMIGILGFSEILMDNNDLDEIKEMAKLINTSGKRLLNTLNSIIDLSKIESGNIKTNNNKFELIFFIREITGSFKHEIDDRKLEMILDFESKELNIITDKKLLGDILRNLIENAIKFTPTGTITVKQNLLKQNSHYLVKIDVIDTGIGISTDVMDFIFDEFRQGSEGINRVYDGNGLGLTISKKFANSLGGNISVTSAQNQGSTFSLVLPVQPNSEFDDFEIQNETDEEIMNSDNLLLDMSTKIIIYFNEDETSYNDLSRLLPNSIIILKAKSIAEVETLIETNDVDLILADTSNSDYVHHIINMIKSNIGFEHIPLIASLFDLIEENRKLLQDLGYNDVLRKPFNKNDVILIFEKWLSNS